MSPIYTRLGNFFRVRAQALKLLGSGLDTAAELKDSDRAEGGGLREAFIREALVARLQGFGELLCLVASAWGDGFRSFATLVTHSLTPYRLDLMAVNDANCLMMLASSKVCLVFSFPF